MRNITNYIISAFIFLSMIFIFFNTFFHSKNENLTFYNFKITKIEITPTKQFVFFNGEKEIGLWNYNIMSNENVKIGDIVYKEKCSKYLYILRENEDHENEEILKVVYTSPLPIEWFCN
ncbi:hypothetical protein [Flavobacterium cerinum]|uniref:Uncharacterized protein n=1 Tax=Flavobacterium cerinum TaxID=2502784 RepID=A0A3S3QF24_9FLAO|nr:hypothetical protein [Flavobacterium cerinum]RWW91775.1 hypothetical protein EPI11_17995 [Flavobacterium cerinum]